ncbi:MAG: hypothetical protein U1A27_03275 [Phycisphaerae bacterium]
MAGPKPHRHTDVVIVPAERLIDLAESSGRWSVAALVNSMADLVVVNCARVGTVCLAQLDRLIELHIELRLRGAALRLCSVSRPLAETLRRTRLERLFDVATDADAALAR